MEIKPGRGGQMVRSAGTAAQLMAKEGAYAQVRLPSGEVRKVPMNCRASIGQVGNTDHENVRIGKAGRSRHMGIRPTVRGVAMNPVDHPHGGGEGKSPVGMPAPMSPWGKPTQGVKTRKHRKYSNKMIVKKRPASEAREEEISTMSRSIKKGPYIQPVLLKRVPSDERAAREESSEDLVARFHHFPGLRRPYRSPCTTAASMCRSISPRIWSATSSAKFAPTRTFRGHAGERASARK